MALGEKLRLKLSCKGQHRERWGVGPRRLWIDDIKNQTGLCSGKGRMQAKVHHRE